MSNFETIRKRLAEIIKNKGLSYREISLKIGHKEAYIQQFIKYGYPKRLSELDRKRICLLLSINERELMDDELSQNSSPYAQFVTSEEFSSDEFINLDIFAAKNGMDLYQNHIGRVSLNFVEFNNWNIGNPYSAKVFRLSGDYMEPTIINGSLIIFDSSINTFCGDGIYLIKQGTATQLKRIQMTKPETLALKVDNPRYESIHCSADEIEILGKASYTLSGRPL